MRLNESKGKKWRTGTIDADDEFRAAHNPENASEHDAMQENIKRTNLVQMFLKGTEVDEYIIKNLYGKERLFSRDDPNVTIGEMTTTLDGIQIDDSFTHHIQAIHKKSLLSNEHKMESICKLSTDEESD